MMAEFLRRNPRILVLLLGVILVGGLSSALVIPTLEDPVLRKRVGVVSTAFPGADAARVESFVSSRLERRLQNIFEIKQVRSNSRQGISNLIVELRDDVNQVDEVWDRIDKSVDAAQVELPAGCLEPELEIFPLKAYAAIIALQWRDRSSSGEALVSRIAGQFADRISGLSGTEQVDVFGDGGEELLIEVDPQVLSASGLTVQEIASQVSTNFVTQPAGGLRSTESSILLDLPDAATSESALAKFLINDGTGQSVALGEMAEVNRMMKTPRQDIALIDGREAIVVGALVNESSSMPEWTAELNQLIVEFSDTYRAEVSIESLFQQQQHISARLETLLRNLILGTLAVVGIVWLLMGWRSMIVVGLAVPLSAALVLLAMRVMEIPLHQMSITGLIVALGLLIDNAIVIVEDIRLRRSRGSSVVESVMGSIAHLKVPLAGSTLTTTLAFLPIATLPGPSGEFVGTIAISVILAISASFLLSMTVIPALFAFLQPSGGQHISTKQGVELPLLRNLYHWSLGVAFRFPLLGVLVSAALPALGFWTAAQLPEQFFPASDRQQIQIEVELSADSVLEKTRQTVSAMQSRVVGDEGVANAYWFIGRSAPTFYYNVVPRRRGTPFYAQAIVDLNPGEDSLHVVNRLQQRLDQDFSHARVIVRQLQQGPPFDAPVELHLQGPDLDVLRDVGSQLRLSLTQLPEVTHTRSDLEETIAKLSVEVDPQQASEAGLNRAAIAGQMYQNLEGVSAGTAFDGGLEIPVRVKIADAKSPAENFARLGALEIYGSASGGRPDSATGSTRALNASTARSRRSGTPLSAVTNVVLDGDVGAIVRVDGLRTNEIMAYIRPGVLPSKVVADFKERLEMSDFILPSGYELTFGGEAAQRSHAVKQLIANAPLLLALMVLTLVGSLGSFRQALIVAIVGGLSIGLSGLALTLFGYPLGFMAIVGTMGLVGVAINDSIVVLAAISQQDGDARIDRAALVTTVSGCTRHIVATTLTTIAGFTPLILSGGGFWPPLAVTIAAGVAGATLMALYLVPSFYLIFCRR